MQRQVFVKTSKKSNISDSYDELHLESEVSFATLFQTETERTWMRIVGAIDVGSNAIRLAIGSVSPHGDIKILKKVREPVRLGQDVFSKGFISEKTIEKAIEAFQRFRSLLKENDVQRFKAVATSAAREAKNGNEFVKAVYQKTGLKIDIIDGKREGELIYSAVDHHVNLSNKNALLVDIGGGSVELTVARMGKLKATQTFPLGTVRLLSMIEEQNLKEKQLLPLIRGLFEPAKDFLAEALKAGPFDVCVGTGGNFECLGKLRVAILDRTSIYSMTHTELQDLVTHLSDMSVKERIQFLRLKPDRADVVVPAAMVASEVMRLGKIEMLSVPFVGLRDGILAEVASELEKKNGASSSRGWVP